MKLKGLLALVLSLSLALVAGSALAGGKSGKSDKSDKSAKYSMKSEKSGKSGKRGNGYGHCKSDKSGKGHSKKRGKGHDRDDDCDDGGDPPPVLTCSADVVRDDIFATIFTEDGPILATETAVFVGRVCDVEPATLEQYTQDLEIPAENLICFYSDLDSFVGPRQETASEYYYEIEIRLDCQSNLPV